MESNNKAWNLERFLDTLILELDKAQDTVSYKGVTRKLTYSVKDMALEMQVFPEFDGKRVQFVTAGAGQSGASRLSIQLGSITDRQIADHASKPISVDDISIDDLENVNEETRRAMEEIGITSTDALKRMEQNQVNVEAVLRKKAGEKAVVDYKNLASVINKAHRKRLPPSIANVSLSEAAGEESEIILDGHNLALDGAHPVAVLNGNVLSVTASDPETVRMNVKPEDLESNNRLEVLLDPYTLVKMELKA